MRFHYKCHVTIMLHPRGIRRFVTLSKRSSLFFIDRNGSQFAYVDVHRERGGEECGGKEMEAIS